VCTALTADDEKKHFNCAVSWNGLAIRACHAMLSHVFAFSKNRAATYDATPVSLFPTTAVIPPDDDNSICFCYKFHGNE
jgi:hypothetical protein